MNISVTRCHGHRFSVVFNWVPASTRQLFPNMSLPGARHQKKMRGMREVRCHEEQLPDESVLDSHLFLCLFLFLLVDLNEHIPRPEQTGSNKMSGAAAQSLLGSLWFM